MAVYLPYCKLLQGWLIVFSTGFNVGTATMSRHACRAASTQLFNIFQVDCVNTSWTLYKKNIPTIVWDLNGSVPNDTFIKGYKDKFSLDKSGNIWILDIQDSDEAIYSIRCQVGNATTIYEVKLNVLVEPETRCKPKIIRGVDTLTAYLEPDDCGKSAAYAYWLEQPGISVDDNVINLQPGQEAGTVYACINSPALRCTQNSKLSDYCTVFKDESIHLTLSKKIIIIIGVNLILMMFMIGCSIMMCIFFHRRQIGMLKRITISKHSSDISYFSIENSCDISLFVMQKRNKPKEEGHQLLNDLEKGNSTPQLVYGKPIFTSHASSCTRDDEIADACKHQSELLLSITNIPLPDVL